MVDPAKVRALTDACARNAALRSRLVKSPAAVLREYRVVPEAETDIPTLLGAILGGELTEADLGALAGGITLRRGHTNYDLQ